VGWRSTCTRPQARFPAHYTDPQKNFLDFVLTQYVKLGFTELDAEKPHPLIKVRYGDSVTDALQDLGDAKTVHSLFIDMQQRLYAG